MKVGFIGLGNVGAKLAGSLLRNGFDLTVRDIDQAAAGPLLRSGASWGESGRQIAQGSDVIVTCLPSPEVSAQVLEESDGVLAGISEGKIWLKDLSLFDELGRSLGVPLELSPVCVAIVRDALSRYGPRAWSTQAVKRLEDDCGVSLRAPGFPATLTDDEPEALGAEVAVRQRAQVRSP